MSDFGPWRCKFPFESAWRVMWVLIFADWFISPWCLSWHLKKAFNCQARLLDVCCHSELSEVHLVHNSTVRQREKGQEVSPFSSLSEAESKVCKGKLPCWSRWMHCQARYNENPLVPQAASINFKRLSQCSPGKIFPSLPLSLALFLSVSSCHISNINMTLPRVVLRSSLSPHPSPWLSMHY